MEMAFVLAPSAAWRHVIALSFSNEFIWFCYLKIIINNIIININIHECVGKLV